MSDEIVKELTKIREELEKLNSLFTARTADRFSVQKNVEELQRRIAANQRRRA